MDEFGMNGDSPRKQSTAGNTAADSRAEVPRREAAAQRRKTRPGQRGKASSEQKPYGVSDFIFDRRTHMGVGVVLIVLAVMIAVTTISHLAHGAADQSLTVGRSVVDIVESGEPVQNIGGAFGAKLSQMLMAEGLGVGAFVLVVWLAIIGLSLVGARRCKFWTVTFRSLFTAIALSVVVGLLTYNSESYTHWGGAHGHFVNQVLIEYSSWLGAVCVSVMMLGLLASVYLNPLIKAKKAMNEKLTALRDVRRERIERDRRRSLQDVGTADVQNADAKL